VWGGIRERVNGDEVDWLHKHMRNRIMKPLVIALSGAGRGSFRKDGEDDLTKYNKSLF
jgi:hypothetical protein